MNSISAIRNSKLLPLLGALLLALLFAGGCASTGPSGGPGPAGAPAPSERATLGFEGKPITRQLRKKLSLPASVIGVVAENVIPGGPAALAGVRPNDVVERIGGADILGECDFLDVAFNRPPGPVDVVVRRGGSKLTLTLAAARQDALFEKSCRAGVLAACFRQAWSLAGSRDAGDRGRSLELYDSACRAGSADACAYRGLFLSRDGNRESVAVLERACDLGSGGGCATLAFLHATGKFVPKDDRRANALYVKSCALGDEQGCYNEGLMADEGRGTGRDLARAVARYREACEGGSAPACTNLGFLYEHGTGVGKDAPRAAALYKRGCDGSRCQPSNRNGCVNLGRAYRDGTGVAKEPSRAAPLFRDACDREIDANDPGSGANRSRACSLLGALYIDGDGVEKDSSAALRLSGARVRPRRLLRLFQRGRDHGKRNGAGRRERGGIPGESVRARRWGGVLRPGSRLREGKGRLRGPRPRESPLPKGLRARIPRGLRKEVRLRSARPPARQRGGARQCFAHIQLKRRGGRRAVPGEELPSAAPRTVTSRASARRRTRARIPASSARSASGR